MKKPGDQGSFNWSKLIIISLSGLAIGIYRDGFSALFPFLQGEFHLTRAQLGLHSTLFFLANMIMGLFGGRLIDVKGSRWGLVTAAIFLGILTILHSLAPSYAVILLLAVLAGSVVSMNTPAANTGAAEWFPREWRGTAMGVMSTAFPIGGIMAATLLPFISIMIGWRKTIVLAGLFAILCGLVVFFTYRETGKERNRGKGNGDNNTFKSSLVQLIKNADLMIISISGLFWGAASGVTAAHFTLFLYLDYGLAEGIAGLGFAVVQFGSVLGRPGWGLICDRLLGADRKKGFLYIGFLFSAAALSFCLLGRYSTSSIPLVFFLAFIVGFTGRGWHGLYYSSVVDSVKGENIGMSTGFAMFFPRAGLMLAPPIFGYIADIRSSYDVSWLLISVLILVSAGGLYLYPLLRKGKGQVSTPGEGG